MISWIFISRLRAQHFMILLPFAHGWRGHWMTGPSSAYAQHTMACFARMRTQGLVYRSCMYRIRKVLTSPPLSSKVRKLMAESAKTFAMLESRPVNELGQIVLTEEEKARGAWAPGEGRSAGDDASCDCG